MYPILSITYTDLLLQQYTRVMIALSTAPAITQGMMMGTTSTSLFLSPEKD